MISRFAMALSHFPHLHSPSGSWVTPAHAKHHSALHPPPFPPAAPPSPSQRRRTSGWAKQTAQRDPRRPSPVERWADPPPPPGGDASRGRSRSSAARSRASSPYMCSLSASSWPPGRPWLLRAWLKLDEQRDATSASTCAAESSVNQLAPSAVLARARLNCDSRRLGGFAWGPIEATSERGALPPSPPPSLSLPPSSISSRGTMVPPLPPPVEPSLTPSPSSATAVGKPSERPWGESPARGAGSQTKRRPHCSPSKKNSRPSRSWPIAARLGDPMSARRHSYFAPSRARTSFFWASPVASPASPPVARAHSTLRARPSC
mmetsp:Transcript_16754/g.38783  ORF Transcript_16754/g.38783 Transcript_16754/m.38783 type:complete len:319 (+) Transcript_16754:342-1298(+)